MLNQLIADLNNVLLKYNLRVITTDADGENTPVPNRPEEVAQNRPEPHPDAAPDALGKGGDAMKTDLDNDVRARRRAKLRGLMSRAS